MHGCGVPEDFITYLPSLIGTMQPIQYQSCFISDSSQDEEFARRLHEKMRGEKLRVWFAPEDMQGGKKLIEQIDRAIQVNDRLLLVLSEHSMNCEWVQTEIRKARQAELREQRQKPFFIRLVSIDRIRAWSCFDTDVHFTSRRCSSDNDARTVSRSPTTTKFWNVNSPGSIPSARR